MDNAKNLHIKHSKTKLEDDLPIPNVETFTSDVDHKIISSIKSKVSQIIQSDKNRTKLQTEIDLLFFELFNLNDLRINELMEKYY